MDVPGHGADTKLCTNCGHEIRRGMLRCRECGQSTVETPDEFVLIGHQLVPSQDPKCPLCGAFLEPGTTDCPACTSALLDQLLNGPELNSAASEPLSAMLKLRVRRVGSEGAPRRSAPDDGQASTKPGAAPPRARQGVPAKAKAKGAAAQARSKQAPQFATPADILAANRQAVNQHAAQQQAAHQQAASKDEAASQEEDPTNEEDVEAGASTTVETNAACLALLASLATADAQLRCGIATALGKLGDKEAMLPLERHLGDQDIRVRRAVAAALVQLGHPKGQALLEIAERKPAASVLMMAKPIPKSKPRKSSGDGIDPDTLKKVGGAIVALAVVGGGLWYWMNSTPSRSKKSKSAAAKKAAAKKGAATPKEAAPPTPKAKASKKTDDF